MHVDEVKRRAVVEGPRTCMLMTKPKITDRANQRKKKKSPFVPPGAGDARQFVRVTVCLFRGLLISQSGRVSARLYPVEEEEPGNERKKNKRYGKL